MKAFISYSVANSDEFILTLLSSRFREKSFSISTSQNFYNKDLDLNTMNEISESNLFVGIVLNNGKDKDRVIEEWKYSVAKNIHNILLIENNITNEETLTGNYITFSRSNTKAAINEIKRRMNSGEASTGNSDIAIPWALGGEALISILSHSFNTLDSSSSKFVSSGRLLLIEQQLLSINSASFQNLCDIYLALREQEFASINRTGSQLGKQKTVKGTPDTFFRLTDGSLRYVEYTTKKDGLVAKIIEDIEKCLDSTKTGVPINEVYKIIICFNSRLKLDEETEITKYAISKNIRIELIGLDWLALEIYSKYLILAKDILGIPLDTGQLLPLQNFIDEYNNKGGNLSTPLDNIFLHREAELSEIENILATKELIIISGFPGVGKTKIAIEAINKFISVNVDYSAFAVSKKDQDISEDLKIHLQQEKNYVLLVDDANRQLPNFKQILGVFKEIRKGKIKLVITVRDYALHDITNECSEYDPYKIVLKKFSDTEITELINSDSFEIRNPKYQKRIVVVADGNARLAVMAARIANQKQERFLFGDVSDLYDSYFQTFIKDYDIFGNKILIKTLGIISFFFSIDRSNKSIIDSILNSFEIDYHDFNEAIDELEKRELVEVRYNNVRVSEQVMATYFFYKVFIKDEILPFKILLFNFFNQWKKRFSDTIIPSNNSFGYENVLNKINNSLDEYLYSIYTDEEKVLSFFSIFWFYKLEETLTYFHQKIKQLPEPENPIYDTKYERNDFIGNTDKTLDYISDIFYHYTESFVPALELAFEYCRKKPEKLSELIKNIKEKLLFDDDDHRYNFERQVELFNLIIVKFKEKKTHYVEAFFALAGTFLSHYYQISKSGRSNSITLYQYPLPLYEVTENFRKAIWTVLFDNYKIYPKEILSILKNFRPGYRDTIIKILEFDLSLLLPFIELNLDNKSFENIHFINDFIAMLDRKELQDRSYQLLLTKFRSKEYENFKKLDWNKFRGKENLKNLKHDEFESLKEQEIRSYFVFKNVTEFSELHNTIKNALLIDEKSPWSINQSLNIITEENFLQNNELGFQLLESILNNYPNGLTVLYKAINVIVTKSEEWGLRLWNLLKEWRHETKIDWELAFYYYLPKEQVNIFYKTELLEVINSINVNCYLRFETFEKFSSIEEKIIDEILKIVVDKNETLSIKLPYHFFEKYSNLLKDNLDLLTKAYIQQEKIDYHFDLNFEGLKTIVKLKPSFLLEYVHLFYNEKTGINDFDSHKQLPFVWEIDNYKELVESTFNLMIENSYYVGILKHPINIFFHNLNNKQEIIAKQFLLDYITKYNTDHNKINSVFDVLRHVMNDFFEEAFLYYLDLNTDLENFRNIWWRGNGGSYSGDVIIGDIEAKEWQNILEMVNKSKKQLELIPIRTYIKNQIKYALKSGEEDRKRRFVNPEGW